MTKILLVDDHPAVIEGTKFILEQDDEFEVIIQSDVSGVLDLIKSQAFDIMIFDLFMPPYNGIDLAVEVMKVQPEACILIYTGFDISPHLNRLIDMGIAGYMPKTVTRDQLINAIRCALRREVVLPLDVFRTLRREGNAQVEQANSSHKPALQERDLEILQQIAQGKGNRQISEQMCMSQRSLEYHLTHLFQKLGVKSRIEAVSKAKDIGVLDPISI
ncbi:response regulator transcription factor [Paenibacillus wulumuqiensis]|uniref:response regulator transcription factor n=1 Tax=Paenibacillus wulumuqiensis TaxID=1567107 RepID=UPI0006196DD8|nr:response regulator transcription factor [Paenibacillus wulumuqiensis]